MLLPVPPFPRILKGPLNAENIDWPSLFKWLELLQISLTTTNVVTRLSSGAGNLTTTSEHTLYAITDLSAARTVTIRSVDILEEGRIFIIKDEAGNAFTNNITVATEGSETIDGCASAIIVQDYASLMLYSNGSNLFQIGE